MVSGASQGVMVSGAFQGVMVSGAFQGVMVSGAFQGVMVSGASLMRQSNHARAERADARGDESRIYAGLDFARPAFALRLASLAQE